MVICKEIIFLVHSLESGFGGMESSGSCRSTSSCLSSARASKLSMVLTIFSEMSNSRRRVRLIRFFDPGHLMLPNMKDFLLTTAEEAGIKYQYYCGKGGTDAGAAHLKNGGVPSTTIGVCARYIHSHQTLYAMDDFLQAQAFLQALVKKLDRSTVDLIKNY